MCLRHDARISVRRLTGSAATHEHQVVGPHTGRSPTASPEPPARRQRSDEQLPCDACRGESLDRTVLAQRHDSGAVGRVQPGPQPARLGALDMSPEALAQWYTSAWTTGRTRPATSAALRWAKSRDR